uniref:Transposase n=1 Tax=Strongyloides papillosus TaxID=174720 RepID=A0A0N5CCW8_STREA
MVFTCNICWYTYGVPGTAHSIYPTSFDHFMSKSYFKTWRDSKSGVNFRCPKCNKITLKNDCHPVYDMSDEDLEGINKAGTSERTVPKYSVAYGFMDNNSLFTEQFMKRTKNEVCSVITLFDLHNGHLLLVGFVSPTSTEFNIKEIISWRNDITRHSVGFHKSLCMAIAFNKFRNNLIGYISGFDDVGLTNTGHEDSSHMATLA